MLTRPRVGPTRLHWQQNGHEFKFLDLARVKETTRQPIIFDGRNLYDPERMRRLGFEYYCVGRPAVIPADSSGV